MEGPGRRVHHSLKRDSILREAEASLKRLGADAIDLYQIHWPNPEQDIEEGWAALAELKPQGLVDHIGVSNFDVEQLRRIRDCAGRDAAAAVLVGRARRREEVLPYAEGERIGVIVYSPMGSGLLTGRMTRERIAAWLTMTGASTTPVPEPRLSGHLALVQRLTAVAGRYGTTPGAVAVAWTLRNPAVDGAIVGFRAGPGRPDPPGGEPELSDEDSARSTGVKGGSR